MAKTAPAAKAAIPAPTSAKGGNPTIKHLRDMTDKERLPNQAQVILSVLKAAKGKTMSQSDLVKGLVKGGLKTVQSPERIFTFYRKKLVDEGFISVA